MNQDEMQEQTQSPSTIWTIGHSTRPITEFIELLTANGIMTLADVRSFPSSRRYPQFNQATLRSALATSDIDYAWLQSLGGRRKARPDSPNVAWRNDAFRGYADHIQTEEFASGLFDLLMVSEGAPTAIMCSEAVWWRCHRSLISDVLRSIGYDVRHIIDSGKTTEHPYTSPARIVDGVLTYESDVSADGDDEQISLLT